MRMPALISTLVAAALLLMVPVSAEDGENLSRKQQIDESAKKVKELQNQRIATLQEMVDIATGLFRSGRVEFDEVADAQLRLLEAQVDVAEKASDRIELYKNMVDVLQQYEAFADNRVKQGRGTRIAVLKIKARRLKAETRLEQAKAEEAPETR